MRTELRLILLGMRFEGSRAETDPGSGGHRHESQTENRIFDMRFEGSRAETDPGSGGRRILAATRQIITGSWKQRHREQAALRNQVETRKRDRITEAPRNRDEAEAAARILWQDAQWLRTKETSYVGLQYARIVLQDIRAIIVSPGAISLDQQRQLIRSKIAIATINLRDRLIEAGVDDRNIEQLQHSIKQRLEELEQAYLNSASVNDDNVRGVEHGIDDLLTRIDNSFEASDHRSLGEEAKVLIKQTSDLAEDVGLTLAAVMNIAVPIPPTNDLARTAVITTLVTHSWPGGTAPLHFGISQIWRLL